MKQSIHLLQISSLVDMVSAMEWALTTKLKRKEYCILGNFLHRFIFMNFANLLSREIKFRENLAMPHL